MDQNMETPPLPRMNRSTKTPFQYGGPFQRSIRSEIQPNRTANGSRLYPATSQRPVAGRLKNEKTSSAIVSRLGNLIRHKDHSNASHHPTSTSTAAASAPPPPTTTTKPVQPIIKSVLPTTITKPVVHQPTTHTHVQPSIKSILPTTITKPVVHQPTTHTHVQPPIKSILPTTITKPVPPVTTSVPPPIIKSVLPTTATKAVHPITTTKSVELKNAESSKPNAPTRAHSEPSIKYQVQVNGKTYKVLRKIGSGGSAKVYEGFESHTLQSVAIKIINMAQADPRTKESYFNENSLLARLRDSKYVVRLFDSEYKSECSELVIVMEKGDSDLSQVIESHFRTRDKEIDGIFIKFYWRGILQAVNCIHQQGIVHADLKPVNFILVKNEIKLIDFGIAGAIAPEGTSIIREYQIGTINYMAPEALRNRAGDASFQYLRENDENQEEHKKTVVKYNSKADIWSLGCILYNLVYGRPPFDKYQDIISKAQAITNPAHQIHFPDISNQKLLDSMKSCLRYNPTDRPTALELLNDPLLKDEGVRIL